MKTLSPLYLVVAAISFLLFFDLKTARAQEELPPNLAGVECTTTVLTGPLSSTTVTWYGDTTYQEAVAQGIVAPDQPVYLGPNGLWYVGNLVSTLCEQNPESCPLDDGGDEGGDNGSEEDNGGDEGGGSSVTRVSEPRCVDLLIGENGIVCIPSCPAPPAAADVPCLDAIREPFPRGLVTVPNTFTLLGPYSFEGERTYCPDPQAAYPSKRNANLRIVWRMRMDIPPLWRFDERPWNIAGHGAANTASGFTAEHTYETSSFNTFPGDKPYNGPSLTGELLPAYQVDVQTWWTAYVVAEWENWGFDEAGNYVFLGMGGRVTPIDLSQWGYPTSDFRSLRARDYRAPDVEPRRCNIPTPIIEAQSILVP